MRDFSTLTETKRNVSLCLVLVLAVLSTQTLGQDIIDGEGNFFHFLRCLHLFFLRFKKLERIAAGDQWNRNVSQYVFPHYNVITRS